MASAFLPIGGCVGYIVLAARLDDASLLYGHDLTAALAREQLHGLEEGVEALPEQIAEKLIIRVFPIL